MPRLISENFDLGDSCFSGFFNVHCAMDQSKKKKKTAKSSQNKGGQPGWATDEQEEWLRGHLPNYAASQGKGQKALADFWPPLWEGWFEKWPSMMSADAGSASMPAGDGMASGDESQKSAVAKKKLVRQFFLNVNTIMDILGSSTSSSGLITILTRGPQERLG
jgi:hypothetical protein